MLKIAIKSEFLAKHIQKYSYLKKLFVFKINYIHSIKDNALRSELYAAIYTERNIAKSTAVNRFLDIDDVSIQYMHKADINIVHDIAVSSGITSVELFDKIRQSGRHVDLFISDKYSTYYFAGNFITRVFNVNKKLTCGYICSILADYNINRIFFISHLLCHLLNMLPLPKRLEKISLYDQKTMSYLSANLIREISYDLFDSSIREDFTFVRCMNLLQSGYLREEQIKDALENIKLSLKEGGILQVGRTLQDGTNNVSFYQKKGCRFIAIKHINKGFENDTFVLAV